MLIHLAHVVVTGCKSGYLFRKLLIHKRQVGEAVAGGEPSAAANPLPVASSKDAVLDATLIESAARPCKHLEMMAVDREEGEETTFEVTGEEE